MLCFADRHITAHSCRVRHGGCMVGLLMLRSVGLHYHKSRQAKKADVEYEQEHFLVGHVAREPGCLGRLGGCVPGRRLFCGSDDPISHRVHFPGSACGLASRASLGDAFCCGPADCALFPQFLLGRALVHVRGWDQFPDSCRRALRLCLPDGTDGPAKASDCGAGRIVARLRLVQADPDEHNTWQPLDTYLSERAELDVTHGICPDCMSKVVQGASTD